MKKTSHNGVVKQFVAIICALFFLLFLPQNALAGVLQVISVGGVSKTNAATYTIWESTPTIVGNALSNTTVNLVVDGNPGSVTSDARGSWSYTPGGLALGNHPASAASGTDSLAFTIRVIIAPTLAPSHAQPPPPKHLPVTAGPTPFIGLFVAAGSLLALGLRLRKI